MRVASVAKTLFSRGRGHVVGIDSRPLWRSFDCLLNYLAQPVEMSFLLSDVVGNRLGSCLGYGAARRRISYAFIHIVSVVAFGWCVRCHCLLKRSLC